MNEFELRRQLRALDRERSPEQDLWPTIATRIAALPARRAPVPQWSRWAVAALLLVAVGAALRWMAPQPSPTADEAAVAIAPEPPSTVTVRSPLLREADALNLQYRAALAEFAAPLPRELQPAATTLNASAAELRAALSEHPDNPYLLNQLRRTYDLRLRLNQLASLG
jgi:hypothetical protein